VVGSGVVVSVTVELVVPFVLLPTAPVEGETEFTVVPWLAVVASTITPLAMSSAAKANARRAMPGEKEENEKR
jgi:hypothetical protein